MIGLTQVDYEDISIYELEDGMILRDDIINKYGSVLIPAESVVEDLDRMQNMLEQHGIRTVKIKRKPQELVEAESFYNNTIKKNNLAKEVENRIKQMKQREMIANAREELHKTQKSIQGDFEKILRGEAVHQEAIKENIHKTLEIFKSNMNVFQLLEQLKDLDDVTYAHSQNVTIISYALGKWLELNHEQLQQLTLGAMLTDIGKVQVPQELLNKKGSLTNDELLECQKHVIYSHELIKNYEFINDNVKQGVLFHHERIDGSGYPMGLKGDKIPLMARIIAIADVYNALTSDRPYRAKLSPFEAIRILETEFKGKLDSKILYVFLNRIGNCFIGQRVKLSNEETAEIVFISKQNIYRPIVKLEKTDEIVNLIEPAYGNIEILDFI